MKYFILYLSLLILSTSLASAQQNQVLNGRTLELGNFTIKLDQNFKEKKLEGNDLEDAKKVFKITGFLPPKYMYLNVKNNKDFISFMAISNNIGKTYGKNEDFDSFKIEEVTKLVKDGILQGNVTAKKINNLNVIKHEFISQEYNQKICFYHIIDFDKMINIFISYPLTDTKWENVENNILKTIKRKYISQNIYSLNKEDEQKVEEIYKSALSLDTISVDIHREFWSIVNKYGGVPAKIEQLGKKEKSDSFIDEVGLPYQREFYQDALISLKKGKIVQSENRKILEDKLTKERSSKNQDLMEKISKKMPVPYHGENIIFDEEIIQNILRNLDEAISTFKYNITLLFDSNYKKSK